MPTNKSKYTIDEKELVFFHGDELSCAMNIKAFQKAKKLLFFKVVAPTILLHEGRKRLVKM